MTPSPAEPEQAPSNAAPPAAGRTPTPAPLPLDQVSPAFTLRAVLTGMLLAGVLSVCNIYIGLQFGFGINMSLTAVLLSYAFWMSLHGLSGRRLRSWGMLENNISQTACSSGALVGSAGLVAPIPALALLTGTTLAWHYLALWIFVVCLLGILVAIALRRQLLIRDQLPFPLGTATAELLREMHTRGGEAVARVKALLAGGCAAAVLAVLVAVFNIGSLGLPFSLAGFKARALTFVLQPSLLTFGIGGLIGFRACASLLLGAILAYGVMAPPLIHSGHIWLTVREPLASPPADLPLGPRPEGALAYDTARGRLEWKGIMSAAQRDTLLAVSPVAEYQTAVRHLYLRSQLSPDETSAPGQGDAALGPPAAPNFPELLQWLVWPGMTLMLVGALASFLFSWRSVLGALGLTRSRSPAAPRIADVPVGWFAVGLLVVLLLSVLLQVSLFKIAWWMAVVSTLLAFALAIVATRVSGETGITPVGQIGKLAQLSLGALAPQSAATNLMAANVAAGAGSQSADLLDDLKCGHLLGTPPRWQSLAQVCGAVVGALLGSAVYLLLIPNPQKQLLTKDWPAPAAATLKSVAELFGAGFHSLPPGAAYAMILAAVAALVLVLLEKTLPRRAARFVPSAASIGLAFVIPAAYSLGLFLGGLVALCLARWCRRWTQRFWIALCAGLVAGESLTNVGQALIQVIQTRPS